MTLVRVKKSTPKIYISAPERSKRTKKLTNLGQKHYLCHVFKYVFFCFSKHDKMKSIKFCFALMLCVCSLGAAFAQQLPNYNFASAGGSFDGTTQPANWNGSNVNQSGFKFTFVEYRSGEGRDGSNAVYIANQEVGALGITANAPGYLTLGTPFSYMSGLNVSGATAGTEGGVAFTYRPDSVAVWLKRTMGGTRENLHLVAYSWSGTAKGSSYLAKDGSSCTSTDRTDEESDIRQLTDKNICKTTQYATQIAEGEYITNEDWSDWKLVKFPLTYYNSTVPEKFNVIISSGNYPNGRENAHNYPGNSILLDEVTLIYSSKIHELRLGGTPYASFDANTNEYTIEIERGSSIPTITAYRSGRQLSGSEISISYGDVGTTPTTITVKAEDGSSTTTYTINFVYVRDTNCYLNSLSVAGEAVSGFSPKVTSYAVNLPYGTTGFPEITYEKGSESQTVEITECDIPGTALVKVTAENPDYSVTYELSLSVGKLSDTTLSDILIGGKSLSGFNPTKLTYTVELPLGTTEAPEITAVSAYAEGEQTIVIDNQGLNGTSTITVTAPGASASRIYKISYKFASSTNSSLAGIYLDGVALEGFDPATTEYNVNLGPDAVAAPAITWTQGDDYQTVTFEDGGLDGTSRIRVIAQDGVSATIYKLSFTVNKSTVNTLKAIYVGGELIENFTPSTTAYSISLPIGTTELPVITWEPGDDYQTVSANYGSVNGDTKIIVTSQSGSKRQYVLTFSVQKADVSTLKGILLDGVLIDGFAADVTTYNISLPVGTAVAPVITYEANDAYQTITMDEGGLSGVTRITVRSQAGTSTVYSISFTVEQSSNCKLAGIKLDGADLEGFEADKASYDIVLPSGTVSLPQIEAVKGDAYQSVTITKGSVNGATEIKVTAQNGDSFVYTLNFSVQKSANAFLAGISLNGAALEGFDKETFTYSYVLTTETSCPEITVTKADETQKVQISAPALVGTATITVTPQEGDANVYTISFDYAKSSVATLAGISLGGTPLEGFDVNIYKYEYVLAAGTTALPEITVEKGDENQKVEVITNGVNGVATIRVAAEDGTEQTYEISFSVAKSANALLTAINFGDEVITMVENQFDYSREIEKTVTTLPSIVPVKADERATYSISLPANEGKAIINVRSEDGSATQQYSLTISYKLDSKVNLTSLKVGENLIDLTSGTQTAEGTLAYSLSLPYGYATQTVEVVKGEETQDVQILNNHDVITVIVHAEDGSVATYVVNIVEQAATNALLSDLQIYDAINQKYAQIDNFDPNTFEYEQTLAENTLVVPAINPVPADDKQTIKISYAPVDETTIIEVVAGDGITTQQYKIKFNVAKSDVSTLKLIYLGSEELSGFVPETTSYDITLPYESYKTADVPKITVEKADEGEKVEIVTGVIGGASTIKVTSEDGSSITTYTLNFKVNYADKVNSLKSITLGNDPVNLKEGTYDYTIDLPYGTTAAPAITYEKSFDEQSVLVANKGLNGATLTVKSNIGLEDVVYNISYNVSEVSPAALSSITVGGVAIEGFAHNKYKYVCTINSGDSKPEVQFLDQSGNPINKTTDNVNYAEATNTSGDYSATYAVYFHYNADVIPNANFENWSGTKYNSAYKPTSWTAPADCDDKITWWPVTYKTGDEVQKTTGYSGLGVRLETRYNTTLAGSLPGIITTGNMSVSLGYATSTKLSVSGGITFRNTPDVVSVMYNPQSNNRVDNWRMLVSYYAGSTQKENIYSGSYDTKNSWQTANLGLSYSASERSTGINKFNFTLNAADTEIPNDLGSLGATSVLLVDNLTASYNSTVTGVSVNGVAASQSGNAFSVTLDNADYYGTPVVAVTGAVPDQSYAIDYGTESVSGENFVRTMTLTSYAEDLSSTEYSIVVTRPVNKYLKDIKIDGVSLANFSGSNTSYTYTIPAGQDYLPDVEAVAYDNSQNISYNINGNQCQISVTAGNSTTTYIITMTYAKSGVTTLSNIYVDGVALSGFAAETASYTVELEAGTTALPSVSFEKGYREQTVTYSEAGFGEACKLVVAAEDGTTNTYELTFNVLPTTTTTKQLKSLSIYELPAGSTQLEFSADNYSYTFNRAYKTKVYSLYERAYPEDGLTVTLTDEKVTYVLSNANSAVVSEDLTYTLSFTEDESTDVTLKNILFNGSGIEAFDAATKEYTVEIERGAGLLVEPVAANDDQLIESSYDAAAKKYTFTVSANRTVPEPEPEPEPTPEPETDPEVVQTASLMAVKALSAAAVEDVTESENVTEGESATESENVTAADNVYTLTVTEKKSSDATLSSLKIGDSEIALVEGQTEYSHEFAVGTTLLPEVTAVAKDYGASVSIELPENLSGTIIISVTAEDGNTANTYTVKLSVAKSNNAKLAMIYADLEPIANFAAETLTYEYVIGSGETAPEISYQKGESTQTVEVSDLAEGEGKKLVVTAEDGVSTQEYVITYSHSYSDVSALAYIKVNGTLIEGFAEDAYAYSYELPVGTTTLPEISYAAKGSYQTITVEDGGVNGNYVITSVAEDGTSTSIYTITFSVIKSEVSTLSMIYLGGEELKTGAEGFTADKDFSADVLEYNIDLPVGSTSLPDVSADRGDQYQQPVQISTVAENNTVTLTATAENGATTVYTLNFTFLKSEVATLSAIYINGEKLNASSENYKCDNDFSADVFEYNVELPVGASLSDYAYDYSRGDIYQTAAASSESGVYTVQVTAEDGVHANTYKVYTTVKKSDYSLLDDIIVNGISLEGFVPETLTYVVDLPAGTITMPNVGYTAGDKWQTVEQTKNEEGTHHTITVTSHSGLTSVYEISFNVLKSDNAELANLRMVHSDASLRLSPEFDGGNTEYFVALPYIYRENLPYFVPIEREGQTLSEEHEPTDYNDVYSVKVTAEDGVSTNVYTVKFNLLPSEYSLLTGISIDGEALEGFDPEVFAYDVTLPYNASECPVISYAAGEEGLQQIEMTTTPTTAGWQVSITVTAASGDQDEYVLTLTIADSPENRLSTLKAFGEEIEGFDPDIVSYEVTYPPYTSESVLPTVADISYELVDSQATATVSQTDANTIVVQVKAENGDVRNYLLETNIEISAYTGLDSLFIDGVEVEGFDPDVTEYYYAVDFGSTYVDETRVTYELAESGQTAVLYKDGMDVKIMVTAQDGSTDIYIIHFVASSFDPSNDVTADGICITSTDDGNWRFTSRYSNVYVLLADLGGRPLLRAAIPVVDPNIEDPCDSRAEGYLYVPGYAGVHVYVFTNEGRVVKGGKFRAK